MTGFNVLHGEIPGFEFVKSPRFFPEGGTIENIQGAKNFPAVISVEVVKRWNAYEYAGPELRGATE